jgi:hypothetical protein
MYYLPKKVIMNKGKEWEDREGQGKDGVRLDDEIK